MFLQLTHAGAELSSGGPLILLYIVLRIKRELEKIMTNNRKLRKLWTRKDHVGRPKSLITWLLKAKMFSNLLCFSAASDKCFMLLIMIIYKNPKKTSFYNVP